MAHGPRPTSCALLLSATVLGTIGTAASAENSIPAPLAPRSAIDPPVPGGQPDQPRPVGLTINGKTTPDPVLVARWGEAVLVRRTDLARSLDVSPGTHAQRIIAGEPYVVLAAMDGLTARLSDDGTMLIMSADPLLFPTIRIGRPGSVLQMSEIVPAAFVSYDLSYLRWNSRDAFSAFVDAGASGEWGVVGTTLLMQNGPGAVVRLDSAYQRDFPDSRVRLVLGDTFTRGAEWNAPARFAGIRVGTDFALQPQVINFPLPMLAGAATEPSTVDLLSASSQQTFQVQPGAFLIDYQPEFSGAGEVTMMVTDSTGMARQVNRAFYTSPRLLRPGLGEFSIEAGFLRENYGARSFDYSDPFIALFGRYGLSDNLTLAGRIEASGAAQMAGASVGGVVGPIGEFSLAAAVSDSAAGRGIFGRAQFQRIAPTHSFTISYQRDNGRFEQVGAPRVFGPRRDLSRSELVVAGTVSLGTFGDINIGHIDARTSDGARFGTTTASLSGTLGALFFNVGVRRQESALGRDYGGFASVSLPLGPRGNASLRIDNERMIASAGRVPPNDEGLGFQLAAGRAVSTGEPILSGSAILRTSAGDIEVAGDSSEFGNSIRIGARGALVAVASQVVATPQIESGFALVEVEGEDQVTLFLENRPVVAKGGRGRKAILTGLQPYAENRVGIDIAALPITADVIAPEQIVVPGFRQAAMVRFGGAEGVAATLAFADQAGNPVPPGLEVFAGTQLIGRSGFDGLVFFPVLPIGETVTIRGNGYACVARLQASPDKLAMSAQQPVTCETLKDPRPGS